MSRRSYFVLGCVASSVCRLAVLLQFLGLDPLFLLLYDEIVLLEFSDDFLRFLFNLPAQGFLVCWLSLFALECDEVVLDLWTVGRDRLRLLHAKLQVLKARTAQRLLKASRYYLRVQESRLNELCILSGQRMIGLQSLQCQGQRWIENSA